MLARRTLLAAPLLVAAAPEARLPVVASFSILADMVREVGGEAVAVQALVPPDADVHAYEPRPSDLLALRRAAVVVTNGLGLEGWLDRLLPASGSKAARVVAAAGVTPRRLGTGLDPHAWQDPRNAILYVRAIADGLAAALPRQEAALRQRAEAYAGRIAETDQWIAEQFAPIPRERRRILTSHDAFFYYGARYGIDFLGIQGLDTESEPSAGAIAALLRRIKASGIKAVFVENMANPALARMVARESGAVLGPKVYSDALSGPGGPAATYLALLQYNTGAFAGALRA